MKRPAYFQLAFSIVLISGLGLTLVNSQDQDDSKAIKAEVFIKERPAKTSRSTAKYKMAPRQSATVADTVPAGMSLAEMGVTIWRFRRSIATDKTKELVEEDGESNEWTLERIEEGTLLSPGQRVRLGLESLSKAGYLYVINREGYADGTLGDPVLIYPTQKSAETYQVKPGRVIYIPSATGRFSIKPSDSEKKHVSEQITIIVSPQPLIAEDKLGPKSIRLSRQQVDTWQKQWGTTATKFEMDGGRGQAMTEREQSAATDGSPLLTQDDPVPQTVYRTAIKLNSPVLITVPLKFQN